MLEIQYLTELGRFKHDHVHLAAERGCLAIVSYLGYLYFQSKQHRGRAPGPPGLPIIGVGVLTSRLAYSLNSMQRLY